MARSTACHSKAETARLMHTDMLPDNLTDKHFLPGKAKSGSGSI